MQGQWASAYVEGWVNVTIAPTDLCLTIVTIELTCHIVPLLSLHAYRPRKVWDIYKCQIYVSLGICGIAYCFFLAV